MTEKIGRFGHHPDPAVDFCCEVDAIEGHIADIRAGLVSKDGLRERLMRASDFNVGGDVNACMAKDTLRALIATPI